MSDAEVFESKNDLDFLEADEEINFLPEELNDLAAASGTEDDRQRRHDRTRRRELRHKTAEVTAAIAGVAIVYLLMGFVELGVSPPITTGLTTLLIGASYGGIAYWARLSPFRAATTAVGFFTATVVIAIVSDPSSIFHASNFVLVALVVAVIFARQHRVLERRVAASA